jgi:dipeptidyl aminopeptidase/acylaminoacyl peptidase
MMGRKVMLSGAFLWILLWTAACQTPVASPADTVEPPTPAPLSSTATRTAAPPTATPTAIPSPTARPSDTQSPTDRISKTPTAVPTHIQSMAPALPASFRQDAAGIREILAGLGRIAYFEGSVLSTIRADGTDRKSVYDAGEIPLGVSWSPDGRRLVYGSGFQIGMAEADGSGHFKITGPGGDNISSLDPDWSPDGEWIAYITDRSLRDDPNSPFRYADLFIMRPDGTDPRNLSPDLPIHSGDPDWSPSGIWIAITYGDQIYIVNSSTRGMSPITSDEKCVNENPAWSPDGEWIAFAGDCGGGRQLYLISVEEPGHVFRLQPVLPPKKWTPDEPSFSPDGRFLAFANDYRILVMDLKTLQLFNLSAGAQPAWSPAGVA